MKENTALMAGLGDCTDACVPCQKHCTQHPEELQPCQCALESRRQQDIQRYAKWAAERHWKGQRVWLVNCTQPECNADVGMRVLSQKGREGDAVLCASYNFYSTLWSVSVYSLEDRGPDVSAMCAGLFGTHGNRHETTFMYPGDIERLFYPTDAKPPTADPGSHSSCGLCGTTADCASDIK